MLSMFDVVARMDVNPVLVRGQIARGQKLLADFEIFSHDFRNSSDLLLENSADFDFEIFRHHRPNLLD